jgi:hypothetical protein
MTAGTALRTAAPKRPESELKDADLAMRRAKALGGSRRKVLDEAMHTGAVGRLRLEVDCGPPWRNGNSEFSISRSCNSTPGVS